jgi:hypothetical protein
MTFITGSDTNVFFMRFAARMRLILSSVIFLVVAITSGLFKNVFIPVFKFFLNFADAIKLLIALLGDSTHGLNLDFFLEDLVIVAVFVLDFVAVFVFTRFADRGEFIVGGVLFLTVALALVGVTGILYTHIKKFPMSICLAEFASHAGHPFM